MTAAPDAAVAANVAICEALGLNARLLRSVTIVVRHGREPHVIVEHLGIGDASSLAGVLERYRLVAVGSETERREIAYRHRGEVVEGFARALTALCEGSGSLPLVIGASLGECRACGIVAELVDGVMSDHPAADVTP